MQGSCARNNPYSSSTKLFYYTCVILAFADSVHLQVVSTQVVEADRTNQAWRYGEITCSEIYLQVLEADQAAQHRATLLIRVRVRVTGSGFGPGLLRVKVGARAKARGLVLGLGLAPPSSSGGESVSPPSCVVRVRDIGVGLGV